MCVCVFLFALFISLLFASLLTTEWLLLLLLWNFKIFLNKDSAESESESEKEIGASSSLALQCGAIETAHAVHRAM